MCARRDGCEFSRKLENFACFVWTRAHVLYLPFECWALEICVIWIYFFYEISFATSSFLLRAFLLFICKSHSEIRFHCLYFFAIINHSITHWTFIQIDTSRFWATEIIQSNLFQFRTLSKKVQWMNLSIDPHLFLNSNLRSRIWHNYPLTTRKKHSPVKESSPLPMIKVVNFARTSTTGSCAFSFPKAIPLPSKGVVFCPFEGLRWRNFRGSCAARLLNSFSVFQPGRYRDQRIFSLINVNDLC